MTGPRMVAPALLIGLGLAFGLIATANGAGYRYGVSDQAFYIPVVVRSIDPTLFPRDAPLIDAQGHLMATDEILATLIRTTGTSLETLYLGCYLISLALMWTGLTSIALRVYRSPWALVALGAALTLRHRIPETSANSFEPYFHPRMLAFALGTLAVGALLRRRPWAAVAWVAAAALVHVTTALWFSVLVGVALAVLDVRMRRLGALGALAAGVSLAVAVAIGPLSGTLTIMDDTWLQAVASKDSLFATLWPAWAWVANLGSLAVLWWAYRVRASRGHSTNEDLALAWGATALVALFLLTLPLVAARVALPVQFQISRVFWLIDFLATVYLIGVVADRPDRRTRAVVAAVVLVTLAVGRGAYVMFVERPERALFERAGRGVAVAGHHALDTGSTSGCTCARRPWARLEVRHERARRRRTGCFSGGSKGLGFCDLLARCGDPCRRSNTSGRGFLSAHGRTCASTRSPVRSRRPDHGGRPAVAGPLS